MSRYCWLAGKDCDAPIPCLYQCDEYNQTKTKPIKAEIIIDSIKELRKQLDNKMLKF